jgi:hypothetical protein
MKSMKNLIILMVAFLATAYCHKNDDPNDNKTPDEQDYSVLTPPVAQLRNAPERCFDMLILKKMVTFVSIINKFYSDERI